MADKPTVADPTATIPTWATSATGISRSVNPGANADDGFDVSDRPPAGWVNDVLNRIGQWLGYADTQLDEQDVIIQDSVRKTVDDTIAAIKSMGAGGILKILSSKTDGEGLITDERPTVSNIVKLYSNDNNEILLSAQYGLIVTYNATWDGTDFNRSTGSSWGMAIGGDSNLANNWFCTFWYHASGQPDVWSPDNWQKESNWEFDDDGLIGEFRKLTVSEQVAVAEVPSLDTLTKPTLPKAFGSIRSNTGSPTIVSGYNCDTVTMVTGGLNMQVQFKTGLPSSVPVATASKVGGGFGNVVVSSVSTSQITLNLLDEDGNTIDMSANDITLHFIVFGEDD